jgi:hypothetical protein
MLVFQEWDDVLPELMRAVLSETLGQALKRTRMKHGLSSDMMALATRIPIARFIAMENDEELPSFPEARRILPFVEVSSPLYLLRMIRASERLRLRATISKVMPAEPTRSSTPPVEVITDLPGPLRIALAEALGNDPADASGLLAALQRLAALPLKVRSWFVERVVTMVELEGEAEALAQVHLEGFDEDEEFEETDDFEGTERTISRSV